MSKELWLAAHEQLVDEFLNDNPDATDEAAEEWANENADDRMGDNIAHMADHARMIAKETT
jgi:hypothetical protein